MFVGASETSTGTGTGEKALKKLLVRVREWQDQRSREALVRFRPRRRRSTESFQWHRQWRCSDVRPRLLAPPPAPRRRLPSATRLACASSPRRSARRACLGSARRTSSTSHEPGGSAAASGVPSSGQTQQCGATRSARHNRTRDQQRPLQGLRASSRSALPSLQRWRGRQERARGRAALRSPSALRAPSALRL